MRRRSMQVLAVSCLLLSWGCVSIKHSPSARLFVLRTASEPPVTESVIASPVLVGVMPAALPDHLVRSQMVTWSSDNEVHLEEYARWAEPLDVGVTRVVRENLGILLPEYRFVDYPWRTEAPVRCRVQVEVRLFGLQPDGTVRLDGRWALLAPGSDEPLEVQPVAFQSDPVGRDDPDARVEAMSQLLAHLCDELAAGILALPIPDPGSSNASQP